MKKFKHKKTGEIATYKDGILKSSGFCVEIGIEPSNEFWQEVIEKEYEILSFKHNCGGVFSKSYSKNKTKFSQVPEGTEYSEEKLLKDETFEIYSVKRLSDGEVFTIGDNCEFGILTRIFLIKDSNGKDIIMTSTKNSDYSCNILYLKKLKQPLFITEDGVEIFEGDDFYELIVPGFNNKECVWNILPNIGRPNLIYDQEGNRKHFRLWFSNKAKAEEYIIMNKPCLSINDLSKITNTKEYVRTEWLKAALKELVKQKT